MADDVPNPGWLTPGSPNGGQQSFGRAAAGEHLFVIIPSTVSSASWNLLFNPTRATGRYEFETQTRFVLDTRLNPPAR
jgi:RES domain-containing protein